MIISFILAGRDTTSSALTWFFWLLSSHPHVEESIYKEVTQPIIAARRSQDKDSSSASAVLFSYKELQNMHYLHASIYESMRVYPPVLLDSKHALDKDAVLPDGTFVGWVEWTPSGAPTSLVQAGKVGEQRWLFRSPESLQICSLGPRVCLGKEMAFIQMKIVAVTVISMFRLQPPVESRDRTPNVVHSLTARMEGPAFLL